MRLDPNSVYAGYLAGQSAGYALAVARARADLAIMQLDWQAEVTELRRELAEAKAEFTRLKAIDAAQRTERGPDQPLN